MNKKTNIILIMIIVVLCILLTLSLTTKLNFKLKETNANTSEISNNESSSEKEQYTYEKMKGLYSYESELKKDNNGNEYKKSYDLYLYENGTYRYKNSTFAPTGYIGNYIIKDNKIILNYLYSTNSGVGIFAAKGSTEIIINNNKEIKMQEDLLDTNNKDGITLTKNETSEIIEQYEKNTVNDLIETEEKMNQASTKNN